MNYLLYRYNANVESKHPSETSTDYSNSVPVSKHVDIFEPSFGTMGNTKVERMAKRLKLSERMTKTLEDVHKHYRLKGIARFLPEKDTKHIKTVVDDYKDEEAHQMWLDYRRQKLASLAESMEYNQKMNWDVMPEYTKRKNPKKKKLKKKVSCIMRYSIIDYFYSEEWKAHFSCSSLHFSLGLSFILA